MSHPNLNDLFESDEFKEHQAQLTALAEHLHALYAAGGVAEAERVIRHVLGQRAALAEDELAKLGKRLLLEGRAAAASSVFGYLVDEQQFLADDRAFWRGNYHAALGLACCRFQAADYAAAARLYARVLQVRGHRDMEPRFLSTCRLNRAVSTWMAGDAITAIAMYGRILRRGRLGGWRFQTALRHHDLLVGGAPCKFEIREDPHGRELFIDVLPA